MVFSGSAGGTVQVWNLTADTESPACSLDLGVPLNKCRWQAGGAATLAVGDAHGTVHMLDVADSLCTPHADDWQRLQATLHELQQAHDDAQDVARTVQQTQATGGVAAVMS